MAVKWTDDERLKFWESVVMTGILSAVFGFSIGIAQWLSLALGAVDRPYSLLMTPFVTAVLGVALFSFGLWRATRL